jgi:lysyl oxidase
MHRRTRWSFAALVVGSVLTGCDEDGLTVLQQRPGLEPDASPPQSALPDAGHGLGGQGVGGATSDSGSAATSGASAGDDEDTTDLRALPDLALDTAYLVETVAQDFVDVDDSCLLAERCVTGIGTRRVVRFGTRTGNIGTADLVVGKPDVDNPLWDYDACSKGYQLYGYAKYDLLAEPSGEAVLLGAKNGFCMRDSEVYDPALVRRDCEQYDCTDQGISVGCADNYVAGLACQWVDITGIDPGDYRIKVQINAERKIEELDYSNNTGFIPIRITGSDVIVLR